MYEICNSITSQDEADHTSRFNLADLEKVEPQSVAYFRQQVCILKKANVNLHKFIHAVD
jgi:hypothetical protein